jgi:hypothetical protein
MSETHVAVTNGEARFVLRGFRTRIDQPLSFELTRGGFEILGVIVEAQENEIRKELKRHFSWPAEKPSDEKIDFFVALFAEIVSGLKIENLSASVLDRGLEYSRLEAGVLQALLANCAAHFTATEIAGFERFVDEQQDVDGVLAVRIKHRYRLRRD